MTRGTATTKSPRPARSEVAGWFATPVAPSTPPRNELAIKLALALSTPGVDVDAVVQTQRMLTIQTMQGYVRPGGKQTAPTRQKTSPGAWCLNR